MGSRANKKLIREHINSIKDFVPGETKYYDFITAFNESLNFLRTYEIPQNSGLREDLKTTADDFYKKQLEIWWNDGHNFWRTSEEVITPEGVPSINIFLKLLLLKDASKKEIKIGDNIEFVHKPYNERVELDDYEKIENIYSNVNMDLIIHSTSFRGGASGVFIIGEWDSPSPLRYHPWYNVNWEDKIQIGTYGKGLEDLAGKQFILMRDTNEDLSDKNLAIRLGTSPEKVVVNAEPTFRDQIQDFGQLCFPSDYEAKRLSELLKGKRDFKKDY